MQGLLVVLFRPNRQTIMQSDWVDDYIFGAALAARVAISVLNPADPPALVQRQF
jgi:threonine/homoserine efflux transporter RhtA